MKDINDLVNVISELGGKASFDAIVKAYQKKHRMIVFPELRSIIRQSLNSHPSIVQFDNEEEVWVLEGTKIAPQPKVHLLHQDSLADYISNQLPNNLEWERKGESLRAAFVSDYPIDSIEALEMDDYLIAKSGYGNSRSFCRRLRTDLQILSSMGNAWPATFELYYKNGTELDMSTSYRKLFGNNVNNAFSFVKKEIVRLLNAAKENDYRTVEECKINSSFKAKLISVYFPEQYVPVCVKDALYEYCSRAGISYSKDQDMVYGMSALSRWKNAYEDTRNWSNAIVMSFCDWLWQNDLTIHSRKPETGKSSESAEIGEAPVSFPSKATEQPARSEEKKAEDKVHNEPEMQVGIVVKSKNFGEGVVELIEEAKDNKKYLTINFSGVKKKFILPDAFNQGYLTLKM